MCEIFENLSLFTVSDADIKTMRNFSQLTIITSLLSTNNKMETIPLGTCLFECFPSFELQAYFHMGRCKMGEKGGGEFNVTKLNFGTLHENQYYIFKKVKYSVRVKQYSKPYYLC